MAAWHEPGRSLGQPRNGRGVTIVCVLVWALVVVLLVTGWHV